MAIRNFIKKGTYTKIVNIQWMDGYPGLCVVATYESAPSKKYVPFKERETQDADGNDITVSDYCETECKPLTENKINLTKITSDYSLWKEYFANDKWTASDSNIHAQMYKYLLSTPLFEGCTSD